MTLSRGPFDDEFHKTIVDNIADGVYYVDRERTITYWNRGAERITGYCATDVVGQRCYANILSHVDGAGRPLCLDGCPLAATIDDGDVREVDVWLRHRDGHRRPVRVRTAPIRDTAGEVVGAVEVFDDATRMVEALASAERARHDAMTDPLTGLANRRHFDVALEGRLANLRRYGWPFGLLMLDVDHFKRVNDEHGHDAGDAVLRIVAATLVGGVRAGDLVARWGGEEFAVLVEAADELRLREAAERLRVLVARSLVRHRGLTIGVTVSVGGTIGMAGDGPASAVIRADAALYRAKRAGRDRTEIWREIPRGRSADREGAG